MKQLSIKTRITLWFTAALAIIVVLTLVGILSVSDWIIRKTIRDNLIEMVENNVDEIEYYDETDIIEEPDDVDQFINYRSGFLEVDDDFLNSVNQAYTALYDSNMMLIYGENPIARRTADIPFVNLQIRSVREDEVLYYVYDHQLTAKGLDGLWLRGVVSETQGREEMSVMTKLSLAVLPIILLIAVLGGTIIAGRALKPIQMISDTAAQISRGNDLKKRIELGSGQDEIHWLADSFNGMFGRLEKAFEKEKQFTSDVSHELRTPMAVIMAQCEYSMEQDSSAEEYRESMSTIYRQGRRMTELINRMLDLARLEMRPENYPKELSDMSGIVRSVCDDLALIRDKNIEVISEIEDGIEFSLNRQLLTGALSNLVLNAYRYGKTDGHTVVSLKKNEEGIWLKVCDDGIGIAKEHLPRIFDRFYRADSSRTESGTGLGLSMVKEAVEFHGGTVSVESRPGEGSTFTVFFTNV